MASDTKPEDEEVNNLKVPPLQGLYPFPAVELIELGGLSPYVWRDGRYGIGLLQRGEGVLTSGNVVCAFVYVCIYPRATCPRDPCGCREVRECLPQVM